MPVIKSRLRWLLKLKFKLVVTPKHMMKFRLRGILLLLSLLTTGAAGWFVCATVGIPCTLLARVAGGGSTGLGQSLFAAVMNLSQFVAGLWLRGVVFWVEGVFGTRMVLSGDRIKNLQRRSCVYICNHRTRVDYIFLWQALEHMSAGEALLPPLKIVLKQELQHVPFLGWACQWFIFCFMKRNWNHDRKVIENFVQVFEKSQTPLRLLIFSEGTDLSSSNLYKSNAWGVKHGKAKRSFVLHPRIRGTEHFLACMKNMYFDLYDLTIAYDDFTPGVRTSEASFFGDRMPPHVYVHSKRIDTSTIPQAGKHFGAWLHKRFDMKEAMLEKFYSSKGSNSVLKSSKFHSAVGHLPLLSFSLLLILAVAEVVLLLNLPSHVALLWVCTAIIGQIYINLGGGAHNMVFSLFES